MENSISEIFGTMVFNDEVMMRRMPHETYKALKQTRESGVPLNPEIANVVANAMKDWAIEKGATHFTHWFQPMTGFTCEKHESFISPVGEGRVIMEFSGKELIKGEPDASSLPSGGIRATFEARGYTSWDPTSNAFIKDGTLCIPTAFCSYTGESLDMKTPLLRSMEAVNNEALRILRIFGDYETKRVYSNAGAEQEYFLVDKKLFDKRPDLLLTGRTLIGARSPKGQELEDHYAGALRPRVAKFMKDLDNELWKLGVLAKTKHNETAPAQHELAVIYQKTNIACDHNQLIMEMMKNIAQANGLMCLLHEKPFDGVNGSGKHNNWSLSTDTGKNLLDPGKDMHSNKRFLLFVCAVIKGVDRYSEFLRATIATAGNSYRLGGNEAPPTIISMFMGDELQDVLDSLENDRTYGSHVVPNIETGVSAIPSIERDTTDRNRTSPFAFTGNKFEFRSLGASTSIAEPNIVLNTAVADALKEFADELEGYDDPLNHIDDILKRTVVRHKRIIFNGNNYMPEWTEEAKRRGLPIPQNTFDALKVYASDKNIELCERHGIFSKHELESRQEILFSGYYNALRIEALTLIGMIKKSIIPAVEKREHELLSLTKLKKECDMPFTLESKYTAQINELLTSLDEKTTAIEALVNSIENECCVKEQAKRTSYELEPLMKQIRDVCDSLEAIMPEELWPYPNYVELLYGV